MNATPGPDKHLRSSVLILIVFGLVTASAQEAAAGSWNLPPLAAPAEYGNILINRKASKAGEKAVSFSHWIHRSKYTCRVCHTDLEFAMKVNATEITEDRNRKGEFCGACHNGETAFGHTKENCNKCHNGNIRSGTEKFGELRGLPSARYGNHVDWTEAAVKNLVTPLRTLNPEQPKKHLYSGELKLEPEWANFPAAVFPHEAHNFWLDCSNCHPNIFNVQKNTTKHFSMNLINEGKFCGICHMSVAFPINNCKKCHPDLGRSQ